MSPAASARLTSEIITLALFPNRYLHPSRQAALLPSPVWETLAGCPRTEGRLARFVLERAGLPPLASLTLHAPQERFCLLPGPAIATVAAWLGVALNAARIGRMIDARQVARIRQELGPEAHDFAVRRARLLTTQADPLAPDLGGDRPLRDLLAQSGLNHIGFALANMAPELTARLAMKLPEEHARLLVQPRGETNAEAAWQLVRKVVREVEPEWSALLG